VTPNIRCPRDQMFTQPYQSKPSTTQHTRVICCNNLLATTQQQLAVAVASALRCNKQGGVINAHQNSGLHTIICAAACAASRNRHCVVCTADMRAVRGHQLCKRSSKQEQPMQRSTSCRARRDWVQHKSRVYWVNLLACEVPWAAHS